ncbi:hypothetical protein [Actinomadura fibrosa]|uniref:ParB/Sulfiredoxin domain-containing protein n=1 Tax=Actinomadura fibrosa TaxID=111802 RepID=A0ABW2XKT6_9ACTN|nr:hypothetical protein [Actinomadura fibrosa]
MHPVEALLRDHAAARERVVDDHMFSVATGFALPATFRLQVFTAPDALPVMVAIQATGEGPSLTNAAEKYFTAAWRQTCPDEQRPPIWIQRQILPSGRFDSFNLVTFKDATPYTGTEPAWSRITDAALARLVGAPVDRSRGEGYAPRPTEPEPVEQFRLIWAARLPRPHPFRQNACMPQGISWSRRLLRQVRPDRTARSCCWYHGGDWAAATRHAAALVRQAEAEDVPADELAGRVITLAAKIQALPAWQREAIGALVMDPIIVERDGRGYVNGQHRAQALLDQGARRVLVLRYLDPPNQTEAKAALAAWAAQHAPREP